MRAFIPIEVTDDMLVSSSIPEPEANEPDWDIDINYDEGAIVSVISKDSHLIFESLASSNIGNDPVTTNNDVLSTGAKWFYNGEMTNRYRMFNYKTGTPSVTNSPCTVVLRPKQRIDAIALNIKAALVDITVKDGANDQVVYTLDGNMLDRPATTPYEWCFSPFVYSRIAVTFNVPPIADPVIHITITDPSGIVEVQKIAFGMSVHLGVIRWSPTISADNYSKIEWDDFGRSKLTPIARIPVENLTLTCEPNRINAVKQFSDSADAKSVLWSGLDDIDHPYREPLVLFGVYKNFDINIENISYAQISLSLKGT